ncbi:hypothetical protein F4779DRAFT_643422 [Xylariaceae sp. FL0662B]|nr:hypothetical protein F4779DRAFT_643422 [Xylariaceae sp. FL0662B]
MVAIFTEGKTTAINLPRHLMLHHAKPTVFPRKLAQGLASAQDDDSSNFDLGEKKCNSFWVPALVAGDQYEITAIQTVKAPNKYRLADIQEDILRALAGTGQLTQGELKLQIGSLGSPDFKRATTLSIKMTVGDVQGLPRVATPNYSDFGNVSRQTGEFIFLKPDLFRNLFSNFDDENGCQDTQNPYTQNCKFLSHVQKTNITGKYGN